MRLFHLMGFAVLVVLCADTASAQQCLSFSGTLPCIQKTGPINGLSFGVKPNEPPRTVTLKPAQTISQPQPQSIDCKMVKTPSEEARSVMRVVVPDRTINHTMRVIVVPPCKGS
jgi:hypothetical protein